MNPSLFPTQAHFDLLQRGARSLHDAVQLIDTAESCGIDCSDYRAGSTELARRINEYITRFFPNQVTPGNPSGINPPAG
jgi:hypothetical protein